MAQPVWITSPGSLGTIPEGEFYQIPLQAYVPNPAPGESLYYKVVAGSLPPGIQIGRTGLLAGVPKALAIVQGVPTAVNADVTSKFAVRAYTEQEINGVTVVRNISDQTFTLTVTGENIPQFITPAGNIGTYYDGTQVLITIETTDADPSDTIIFKVAKGSLPPGLTIDNRGVISGFIVPDANLPSEAIAGYGLSPSAVYPYDFLVRSIDKNYQFTIEITDGKTSNLRTFEIYVYSRNSLTADNTSITSDNTFITCDESNNRLPVLFNTPGFIGTYRNDNFFAYKFNGYDYDGQEIEYITPSEPGLEIPPGLQLDPVTGWLYGYLPNQGDTQITYNFAVQVREVANPVYACDPVYFSMTTIGAIDTEVIWETDSNLGLIDNGAVSMLSVSAVNVGGRPLFYRLKPGNYVPLWNAGSLYQIDSLVRYNNLLYKALVKNSSSFFIPAEWEEIDTPYTGTGTYNSLPQGLSLLTSGHIAGRTSFNTFAVDLGTTTFDKTRPTRLDVTPETTFDLEHTFTVNAYSSDGFVNVFKTFKVKVNRAYNMPYENLYIQCMPPKADRTLVNSLLQNQSIINPDWLYRADDPNFGIAKNVKYYHAYGLESSTTDQYIESLKLNHYDKTLTLGQIETAQALDAAGNVIYEVVYSKIIDDLVNNDGVSVGKSVKLPYPVNDTTMVYPNSLDDMRTQVVDVIGKVGNILPLWMRSTQANGTVLGFTTAWVIAFVQPGYANRIAYNIAEQFGDQLNLVDFDVDRYELDHLLSIHWDPIGDSTNNMWVPQPSSTTFDLVLHYEIPESNDSSIVFNGGLGYAVGDKILLRGSQFGGVDHINDAILTVSTVNSLGTIQSVFIQGNAPLLTSGQLFYNLVGSNITGTGTGATWDIVIASGTTTTIDQNSMKFVAPDDIYTSTNMFDKYLMFPKRNILK
jgi:hypothetical protein